MHKNENYFETEQKPFVPTRWKTIRVGTGLETANDFRLALVGAGYKIPKEVNDVLSNTAFVSGISQAEEEIDLCIATTEELTGLVFANLPQIYDGIRKIGGSLLSAEAGLQLRLAYKDQPMLEYLWMAMKPVEDIGGWSRLWGVIHDDKNRRLVAARECGLCPCPFTFKWVFGLPKKA